MDPVGFPYNYSLREHLRRRAARELPPWSLLSAWASQVPGWRDGLRAALQALLPLDHTPAVPDVRLLDQASLPAGSLSRVVFQLDEDLALPACHLVPAGAAGQQPAVLYLQASAAGKASAVGALASHEATRALAPAVRLCAAGYHVLVPDLPGCGERETSADLSPALTALGSSPASRSLYEVLRLVDWLTAHPEIAVDQVGLVAAESAALTGLLAALCAPRFKAVALWGELLGFRRSLIATDAFRLASPWWGESLPPGVAGLAEVEDLVGLLAPGPLLLGSSLLPLPAATHQVELFAAVYERLGHSPRLELLAEPTAFADFVTSTLDFFAAWLPAQLEDWPPPPRGHD